MLRVGITGSIGAGKSTVCRLFELLDVPVFYADDEARNMMQTDPVLVGGIKALFGASVYPDGVLDRKLLSRLVFGHPERLEQLNALVHPAAIAHAEMWINKQQAPYILKEAAVFFESGTYKTMDVMVGIDAPEEMRIARVIERSKLSAEEIRARMDRQLPNDEKMSRCDFVIRNAGTQALIPQVLSLHSELLQRAGGVA